MKFDLHMHSNYSDGEYSPRDLILKSINKGIKIISITDHDSLQAYEAIEELNQDHSNIKVIPGVEISTQDANGNRFHILGYGKDSKNEGINNLCKKIQTIRSQTNYEIVLLLKKKGFEINNQFLIQKPIITKSDIAKECLSNKFNQTKFPNLCENESVFIESLIIPGKECFPKNIEYISPEEAIKSINNTGWISILAHPSEYVLKGLELKTIIETMIKYGIQGFETNSWVYDRSINSFISHKNDIIDLLGELGLIKSMILTGGSDFHSEQFQGHKVIPLGGSLKFDLGEIDQKIMNLLSSTK